MKKVILYGSPVLVIILLAAFVFFKEEYVPIEIKTTSVKIGEINKVITATGTVEPLKEVQVGTQVSGVIQKLYVDYNSQVKANQLIAQLDPTNLEAAFAESQANLLTAQNELSYQQNNYDRIKKLHEAKVVSDTDFEEASYKLKNAKASLDQRKSDVSRAKTNLSYASIYSPIDGVVISRSVEIGQTVAASYNTPTLFTIAKDLKEMQLEVDVDEADIGQVKAGQNVTFTVDAYPDEKFSGVVTQVRLEPVETSNVITYTVIVKADNPQGKLMPGLTASVEIFTLQLKNIKTVEAKALSFQPEPQVLAEYKKINSTDENGEKFKPVMNLNNVLNEQHAKVWLKKGNNIVPMEIFVGVSDGVNVQVISGLVDGDEVIYTMTQGDANAPSSSAQSSPFMPKPPGRK